MVGLTDTETRGFAPSIPLLSSQQTLLPVSHGSQRASELDGARRPNSR